MGNRAVITTKAGFENNGTGVYLHWNGGRDSVEAFCKYCELRGFRSPETDTYGFARFCQIVGNFFHGSLSLGVGQLSELDCDNYDNGLYIIDNWKIVGRKYKRGPEQKEYKLDDMLHAIDEAQPEQDRIYKPEPPTDPTPNDDTDELDPLTEIPAVFHPIAAAALAIDGIEITCKGAQTEKPVLWISGETYSNRDALKALGLKYSAKRRAWYIGAADVKAITVAA